MPESRGRKKPRNQPAQPATPAAPATNPTWWVPVMVSLMVGGLLWVVVTYIAQSNFPVPGIGNWNLAIGFVLMIAGFMMTMRWR